MILLPQSYEVASAVKFALITSRWLLHGAMNLAGWSSQIETGSIVSPNTYREFSNGDINADL